MKRIKKFAFAALAIAASLLLIEGASFVALRVLVQQTDVVRSETHLFDAHRNHRLNPAFQLSDEAAAKLHAEDGFRRSEPVSLKKPANTVRIIVLGTSALYGIGAREPFPAHPPLANDETITHFLEQFLRERLRADEADHDVEVINAGVSAYRTFQHLMYLNSDLLAYEPDIVINFDGHNDFYAADRFDRWNTYAYSTSILVDEFNGRTFFLPALTGTRALSPYSNFFNLLERVLRRTWYGKVELPLPHTPSKSFETPEEFETKIRTIAENSYLRDLCQIHELGRFAGYDHCVFLQPEILLEDEDALSESDRRLQQITRNLLAAGTSERKQQVRALLPELFGEYEIPFFDIAELAPVNDERRDLYIDYCHLTPAGAELTARSMLDVVYQMFAAHIQRKIQQQTNVIE